MDRSRKYLVTDSNMLAQTLHSAGFEPSEFMLHARVVVVPAVRPKSCTQSLLFVQSRPDSCDRPGQPHLVFRVLLIKNDCSARVPG